MSNGKKIIIVLVTLVVGFTSGFVLRPIIMPPANTAVAVGPAPPIVAAQARGTQYFGANIDEARQVIAGCRDGWVRGAECANAEAAIITVEAQERRRRFLDN